MIRFIIFPLLCYTSVILGQVSVITPKKIHPQKYFYKNGGLALEKFKDSNRKLDSIKSYHPNGNLFEVFYYDKLEKFDGNMFQYDCEGNLIKKWSILHGDIQNVKYFILENDTVNTSKRIKEFDLYNQKLKKNLRDFDAYLNRAKINYQLHNYTLALNDFYKLHSYIDLSQKINQTPKEINPSEIYWYLGKIYEVFDLENTAIFYKYKAKETAPNNQNYALDFALYLYKIKSFQLCKEITLEILPKIKNKSLAYWILTAVAIDLENYHEAQQYVQFIDTKEAINTPLNLQILGYHPNNQIALIKYQQGQTEEATNLLLFETQKNSNNVIAYKNLGYLYLKLQQWENAKTFLEKAKTLNADFILNRNEVQYFLKLAQEETSLGQEHLLYKNNPYLSPNPSPLYQKEIQLINPPTKEFKYQFFNENSLLIHEGISKNGVLDINNLVNNFYSLKIIYDTKFINLHYIKK